MKPSLSLQCSTTLKPSPIYLGLAYDLYFPCNHIKCQVLPRTPRQPIIYFLAIFPLATCPSLWDCLGEEGRVNSPAEEPFHPILLHVIGKKKDPHASIFPQNASETTHFTDEANLLLFPSKIILSDKCRAGKK